MGHDRIERLTDRQKQILRLVGRGLGSKEIAAKLEISRHTVDDHVREVLRTLEVSDRRQAARLLEDYEGTPQRLGAASLGVAEPVNPLLSETPSAAGWSGSDHHTVLLPEACSDSAVDDQHAELVGGRNRLNAWERLRQIGVLTGRITAAFASLMFAIYLLDRLMRAVYFSQ